MVNVDDTLLIFQNSNIAQKFVCNHFNNSEYKKRKFKSYKN